MLLRRLLPLGARLLRQGSGAMRNSSAASAADAAVTCDGPAAMAMAAASCAQPCHGQPPQQPPLTPSIAARLRAIADEMDRGSLDYTPRHVAAALQSLATELLAAPADLPGVSVSGDVQPAELN